MEGRAMTNSQLAQRHEQAVGGVAIDWPAVYRTLRLNPDDPNTQTLLLICDRYKLDPILKHAVLIQGRPYITRDGLLHVAHTSRQFDGIEVVESPTLDATHWHAKVSVYRKDMGRPFTYPGRYPKDGDNKRYAPEMAIKVAEVMALRRAFDVAAPTIEEQWDQAAVSGDVYPGDALDRDGADPDHRALVGEVEEFAGRLERSGVIDADQRAQAIAHAQKSVGSAEASLRRLGELAADNTPTDDGTLL
jgi:hypothetical protein